MYSVKIPNNFYIKIADKYWNDNRYHPDRTMIMRKLGFRSFKGYWECNGEFLFDDEESYLGFVLSNS